MTKVPKRRKSKDNPYTISYSEELQQYCISFFDVKNVFQKIIISKQLFEAFNKFELEDISQMHKYDKYIEHSEIYEETLYKRTNNQEITIEDSIEKKIINEKLRLGINKLNSIQRRRIIMYYFNNKNLREIAKIEGCNYVSIKNSLDVALKNLKEFFKNDLTNQQKNGKQVKGY